PRRIHTTPGGTKRGTLRVVPTRASAQEPAAHECDARVDLLLGGLGELGSAALAAQTRVHVRVRDPLGPGVLRDERVELLALAREGPVQRDGRLGPFT